MDQIKHGFIQSSNSLYAIPKLRLRILLPAALENKMKVIAVSSNRFQEMNGTTMRLSKYRAYRFQTFDRECKIEGYGEGILRVMEDILKTLEPVYTIRKSKGKSGLVRVIERHRTVKFILHRRIADRLKSCLGAIIKTAENRPLVQAVDSIKSRLAERCVTLSGDSKKLIEASKCILMKLLQSTRPYWKKLPDNLKNDMQQMSNGVLNPNLTYPSETINQIQLGKKIEGCMSFYNWLLDAGYSEDHISAMHLAAMVKSQRLIVHKKTCTTGDACDCVNPILETSERVKNSMNDAIDQIQSEITEAKSYFTSKYGPSFVMESTITRSTIVVGNPNEKAFFEDSELLFNTESRSQRF